MGRAREAVRQSGVKRLEPYELDRFHLDTFDWTLCSGVIVGTGCESEILEVANDIRSNYGVVKIGAVLKKENYLARATALRVEQGIYPILEGDLTQLVNFVIECDRIDGKKQPELKNRGVVGLVHFKGGVGTTSLTTALAACWARHGLQVALLDFDDVTPVITSWSQAEIQQRRAVAEFLRLGEVPEGRLNEILYPVEGYEGRLFVVPQPEYYGDSFHFKSNAIPEAPGVRTYIESLLLSLRNEFDVVVIDLAHSWGIATFVALAMCQKVLLICDDDPLAMRQTIVACERLIRETNNEHLLGLRNWNMVLNAHTGLLVSLREFERKFTKLDIFSPSSAYSIVSYSRRARFWGDRGSTLFDLADHKTKGQIIELAFAQAPFIKQKKWHLF
jgi:cellulose biosynthesis protein BcsQ